MQYSGVRKETGSDCESVNNKQLIRQLWSQAPGNTSFKSFCVLNKLKAMNGI
jgi:hypothetical protein